MRLILHAGTHKTGTSTIQRALYDNRDRLRDHGVVYPDPQAWFGGTSYAHHPLVHAVARQDDDLLTARRMLSAVHEQTRPEEVVLLSAEPAYRHVLAHEGGGWWHRHRAFLKALAEELVDFDTEVVLVFRRRDGFIESIYHERAAHGFDKPFDAVVANADRLLDYDAQVDAFAEAFPATRTLSYEDLAGPDLVADFLAALELPVPQLETGEWERQSVDARLSLWMVAAHREDPDPELVVQRRRFAKNPVSDDLFEDYGRVTLWTDPGARKELLLRYGDDGDVIDDRAPAVLTPDVEDRVDDAFDEYLVAKGLPPLDRRARRRT